MGMVLAAILFPEGVEIFSTTVSIWLLSYCTHKSGSL